MTSANDYISFIVNLLNSMYKQVLKGMMICDICNFLSRYGLVHCNEQFWQPLQLLDFPRLVSYLSLWLCTVMLFISREIGWQMYTFWLTIYMLDTMACTWWDKRRGVWWYGICRNQEKHARGVWVGLQTCNFSLICKLHATNMADKKKHNVKLLSY